MIIRIGSHRAWDKVKRELGYSPKSLWNAKYPGSYGLTEITEDEFSKIKDIKMISKSKIKREELSQCISWIGN